MGTDFSKVYPEQDNKNNEDDSKTLDKYLNAELKLCNFYSVLLPEGKIYPGMGRCNSCVFPTIVYAYKNLSFLFPSIQTIIQNDYDFHNDEITGLLRQLCVKAHLKQDSIYDYIIRRDLENFKVKLQEELKSDINFVEKMDATGANLIHIAYMYEGSEIARYLVKNYPHIAIQPYGDKLPDDLIVRFPTYSRHSFNMPFAGQNILHLTIANRNIAEVRWILEFYHNRKDCNSIAYGLEKLLTAEVRGSFFRVGAPFYFGGLPLHFAACTGDEKLFDMVLSYANKNSTEFQKLGPNAIFMRDSYGNTVLHLCVKHKLKKMYAHVVKEARESIERDFIFQFEDKKTDYAELKSLWPKVVLGHGHGHGHNSSTAVKGSGPGPANPQAPMIEAKGKYPRPRHFDQDLRFKFPADGISKSDDIGEKDRARRVVKEWAQDATDVILRLRLHYALNQDYLSPLTLAAYGNGKKESDELEEQRREMLDYLFSIEQAQWHYGPLSCYFVNLEGLEIPYSPEHYEPDCMGNVLHKCKSVIDILCAQNCDKCIKIPAIKKVIDAKWKKAGYRSFLNHSSMNFIICFLITSLSCLVNHTPAIDASMKRSLAIDWVTALYPITAVFLFFLWIQELPYIFEYRVDYWGFYGGVRGAAKFDKIARTIIMITFTAVCIEKTKLSFSGDGNIYSTNDDGHNWNPQDYPGLKISMAISVLVSYIYLYYFFMGFDSTGPFVLTMTRIIGGIIPFFLTFYSITLLGFAGAISVITNLGDPRTSYGFGHVAFIAWNLIKQTVGLQNFHEYDAFGYSDAPNDLIWILDILQTSFYVCVVLIMLNLLIGMVSNTYNEINNYNDSLLLMEKYNMMSSFERCSTSARVAEYREAFTMKLVDKGKEDKSNTVKIVVKSKDEKSSDGKDKKEVVANYRDMSTKLETAFLLESFVVDSDWNKPNLAKSAEEIGQGEKVILLIIDPQRDFHEKDASGYTGSLAVTGALKDSERVAEMIKNHINGIDEIIVTMDSHHRYHIAHKLFWQNGEGKPPTDYTKILSSDIYNGHFEIKEDGEKSFKIEYTDKNEFWRPRFRIEKNMIKGEVRNEIEIEKQKKMLREEYETLLGWCKKYTTELEKKGKFHLCIWPNHCIMGTKGHSVIASINDSLQEWARVNEKSVTYVNKGQNSYTEMYSALKAEVEYDKDKSTAFNDDLLASLKLADRIIVCGQALSHCVNFTVRDIIQHFSKEDVEKIYLLKDGSSPVGTFEKQGEEFVEHCQTVKVNISSTDTVFHEINKARAAK